MTNPADLTEWHALQVWLEHAEHRVVIPYARTLADIVRPVAVRLRRDFSVLFSLISVHAILHQARRQRDAEGRIIATLDDDYAVVRGLVEDLMAAGAGMSVPRPVRETVHVVESLLGAGNRREAIGVTFSEIADALKLDVSTAHARVQAAISRGYLQNLEERPYRHAQIVLGDPLPEEQSLLPPPDHPGLKVWKFGPSLKGDATASPSPVDIGPLPDDLFADSPDTGEPEPKVRPPSSGRRGPRGQGRRRSATPPREPTDRPAEPPVSFADELPDE